MHYRLRAEDSIGTSDKAGFYSGREERDKAEILSLGY